MPTRISSSILIARGSLSGVLLPTFSPDPGITHHCKPLELFTVHCSLFTVHCSLLTVHCSLLTAHCSLFTTPLLHYSTTPLLHYSTTPLLTNREIRHPYCR